MKTVSRKRRGRPSSLQAAELIATFQLDQAEVIGHAWREPTSGLTIRRIRIPPRQRSPGELVSGLALLQQEIALTDEFELLYNDAGWLIGIIPVLTEELARDQLERFMERAGQLAEEDTIPRVLYLELSEYHLPIPTMRDPDHDPQHAFRTCRTFAESLRADKRAIARYVETAQYTGLIQSSQEQERSSYVHVAVAADGELSVEAVHPLDFLDPQKINALQQLLQREAGLDAFLLPVFPTVYSPALPNNVIADEPYYRWVFRRGRELRGAFAPGEPVGVVGPGTGLDSLITWMATGQPIVAIGINPLELANTRVTAALAGFPLTTHWHDSIISADGRPVIPGLRFRLLCWGMPMLGGTMLSEQRLWLLWDHDPDGATLKRFVQGLRTVLLANGEAIIWNSEPSAFDEAYRDVIRDLILAEDPSLQVELLERSGRNVVYRIALPPVSSIDEMLPSDGLGSAEPSPFQQRYAQQRREGWIPPGLLLVPLNRKTGLPPGFASELIARAREVRRSCDRTLGVITRGRANGGNGELAKLHKTRDALAGRLTPRTIIEAATEREVEEALFFSRRSEALNRIPRLLGELRLHLREQIAFLEAVLSATTDPATRAELDWNLQIADAKEALARQMTVAQFLARILDDPDFAVAMFVLPYYIRPQAWAPATVEEAPYQRWIAELAVQDPRAIDLGISGPPLAPMPAAPGSVDLSPTQAGLLHEAYVRHDMAVRAVVPDDEGRAGIYLAAGMDVINFLLTAKRRRGIFMSRYPKLSEQLLREFFQDPAGYLDRQYKDREIPDWKELARRYQAEKFQVGYGESDFLKSLPRILVVLWVELQALGVAASAVDVVEGADAPTIRFPWTPHESQQETYTISFVDGELDPPSRWPAWLRDTVNAGGVDLCYLRAGVRVPMAYRDTGNVMEYLVKEMPEGAFFVTDDYGLGVHGLFQDFGDGFPLGTVQVPVPGEATLMDAIRALLRRRWIEQRSDQDASLYYGWHVRVRRKPSSSNAAPTTNRARMGVRMR